jgi:sugar lactone lactonase YvrE
MVVCSSSPVLQDRSTCLCRVLESEIHFCAGRAGEECKVADGRELWLLAEMYEVEGMHEWLLEDGINEESVCAAYEFGLVPEGYREEVREACRSLARRGLGGVGAGSLRGVGAKAMKGLVEALERNRGRRKRVRQILLEGFQLVERWWKVNGGWGGCSREEVDEIMALLDLTKLSSRKQVEEIVKPSGLVISELLDEIYEGGLVDDDAIITFGNFEIGRTYGSMSGWPGQFTVNNIGWEAGRFYCCSDVAVHGEGAEQRVAGVDWENGRVTVFNVESRECVAIMECRGEGNWQYTMPRAFEQPGPQRRQGFAAFNRQGELFVSNHKLHLIQVFDRGGAFVRSFGEMGNGNGQFAHPFGLAFTPGGDLLVADMSNNRVQVLREDGTFVSAFGSQGKGEGEFDLPVGVAVGQDGSIYVTDHNNCRVQVFDAVGGFLRTFGTKGCGLGQLMGPECIAVGGDGEIFVSDCQRQHVLEFDKDGVHVQTFGGKTSGDLGCPVGLAVDAQGRVFVACRHSNVRMLV